MGFWSEVDILMSEGKTKEEAIFELTGKNSLTIHEAAEKALMDLGEESDYIDIYEYIIENKLFVFGAKKEKHEQVLRAVIERKCINSNLTYKTKKLLFYKKNKKYGLLSWLTDDEINHLSKEPLEDVQEIENDIDERDIDILNDKSRLAQQIAELEEKLSIEEQNKFDLKEKTKSYEENSKKYKEEIEALKKEKETLIKREEEIDKVKSAINILNNPAKVLSDSKIEYIEQRKKFHNYADNLFYIAASFFAITVILMFISLEFNIFEKNINWSMYLIIVFPTVFPTILSFLFIRQANLKSNEIEKINKRYVVIHEVNQALKALVEFNTDKELKIKTEKVIDKLINNILDLSTEKNNDGKKEKDNEQEFEELIKKVDFIMKSIKNINTN